MSLPSLLRTQSGSLSQLPKHCHLSCAPPTSLCLPRDCSSSQYPAPAFRASHGVHAAQGALPTAVFLMNASSFFKGHQG